MTHHTTLVDQALEALVRTEATTAAETALACDDLVRIVEEHRNATLSARMQELLDSPVETITVELPVRARKAVTHLGAKTVRDLVTFTYHQMMQVDGCHRRSADAIHAALWQRGLYLGMIEPTV